MRIATDTGGTFTDCVFVRDGKLQILKVPSQPKNPAAAIAAALQQVQRTVDRPQRLPSRWTWSAARPLAPTHCCSGAAEEYC